MPGQIKVSPTVVAQIADSIGRLAKQAGNLTTTKAGISNSKGKTADALTTSLQLKSEFASTLSSVLESTAKLAKESGEQMVKKDQESASQF